MEFKEIKFYFHKYPWVFYLAIINSISFSLLSKYNEGLFNKGISHILGYIILEIVSISILILIIALIAKHVFDSYFVAGERGLVYFPAWFFVAGLFLEFLFIFLPYQDTITNNFNIYNSIFILFTNSILFIIYRKR